ncbi:hypothetical protein [Alienimonas sp. DA493]|uniref:hypothetical protein n=1 Tax=Alienimonas sp. DA493 TaxID=3373605 RepID=UPI00375507E6
MTAPPADPAPAPRGVLIVCADLLTGGPLVQAVRNAGLTPTRALSAAKAEPGDAAGVVLDLSLPGALAWLEERPADGPPVLSFGPHVHAALLKAARAADRGPVLTRSQLAEGLPAWLATL